MAAHNEVLITKCWSWSADHEALITQSRPVTRHRGSRAHAVRLMLTENCKRLSAPSCRFQN